jgi:hypothetical protein
MKKLATALVIGCLAWYGVAQRREPPQTRSTETQTPPISAGASHSDANRAELFTCDGRTHCSQMSSCEEATYFIEHCPNTRMDGDNDGVPCERQLCQ